MSRVKRGPHRKQKRKRILKLAKGYYGKKKNAYRIARQAVERAQRFSYRDRRQKKREFRKLWIVRINAASRENGLSYNRLISGLRKSGLELNRKVLADIAVHDPEGFAAIVEVAQEALAEDTGVKVRPATEPSKRPERKGPADGGAATPAKPKKKKAEPAEAKKKKKEPAKAETKQKEPAKAEKKAEKPAKAEAKPAAEKKPAAAGPKTAKDLEALTVPELKELAEARGISEGDVEGSGANGNVVKADWVRVLSE